MLKVIAGTVIDVVTETFVAVNVATVSVPSVKVVTVKLVTVSLLTVVDLFTTPVILFKILYIQ